jgi:CDP-glycerol glycerophosphotransferase (TagB/SpsB family)
MTTQAPFQDSPIQDNETAASAPLFTIALFAIGRECWITIESLFAQDIGFDKKVQLVVSGDEDMVRELTKDQRVAQHADAITVLPPFSSQRDFYRAARDCVRGQYLHFAECGAAFEPALLSSVAAAFAQNAGRLHTVLAQCIPVLENQGVMSLVALMPAPGNACLVGNKKTALLYFNFCFFDACVPLSFDADLKLDALNLAYELMRVLKDNPSLYVLPEQLVTPCLTRSPYSTLYDSYRDDPTLIERAWYALINLVDDLYDGSAYPTYVQSTLLTLTDWCARETTAKKTAKKSFGVERFEKVLKDLLSKISDDCIMNSVNLQFAHRAFLLEEKRGYAPQVIDMIDDRAFCYDDIVLTRASRDLTRVEFVDFGEDCLTLHIHARFYGHEDDEFKLYLVVDGERQVECELLHRDWGISCFGKEIYGGGAFLASLDYRTFDGSHGFQIFCEHDGFRVLRTNINFGKFAPISEWLPDSYAHDEGHILSFDRLSATFHIDASHFGSIAKREGKYLLSLATNKDIAAKKAVVVRLAYHAAKRLNSTKIWLISDRTDKGDDNGEAFMKYLASIDHKGIKPYFVIDKKSDEGKRIAQFAKVVSPNSWSHKFLHLLSDYVASSQSNEPVVNPLKKSSRYFKDILSGTKYVFLQHGVTKDDMSAWLNLYNRNLNGLVVTTNPEYQSMFDYDYFYEPERIWLTGFPRFDLLYHDERKRITLMPTWRKYLMYPTPDPMTGKWILRGGMKESDFAKFYNGLFNSKELAEAAERLGYQLCFKPHPNLAPYLKELFDIPSSVQILGDEVTYREVFATSDLLLTDFSSVAFDFAYLRKPVVYAHFDVDILAEGGHTYSESYFDYERDGFGEVTYTLDETVSCLIAYMEHDCKPGDEYLERMNNTFAFDDKESSRRVFERMAMHGEE